MKNLFAYFIDRYKLSFVILIAGFIIGGLGMVGLRREARPPVDFARVMVLTMHPGASSAEVEEFITDKLEQKIQNISGIYKSHSISSPSLSQITLYLDLNNVDIKETVNEIHQAVQSVNDLPVDLLEPPQVIHFKASEIPIMYVAIVGAKKNRHRVAHELKSLLQNLPNIANINMSGFRKREYQVLMDPQKVKQHFVSLSEVIKALRSYSRDISAGTIRSDKTQQSVRIMSKSHTIKDLENIVVRSNFSGKKIFIKDIAQVKDAEEEQVNSFFVSGEPAVSLQISKKEKKDIIQSVKQIEQLLQRYKENKDFDLKLVTLYDESEQTKKRLNIVTNNGLLGMFLVLLILFIFLPGWPGIAAAFSLPFSIFFTIALISFMGVTFNIITMCALVICIGMLVDNSIVISEHYAHLRLKDIPPKEAALNSVMDLAKPVYATTLTTVLAFLPMLLTKGVMGQFIKWLPIVVSIALMVSWIESFILLPCRLRFTMKKTKKEPILFSKIKKHFEGFVFKSLERKYLSLFIILGIVIGSLSISKFKNRFILFPSQDVELYNAHFEIEKHFSLKEMEKKALTLETNIIKTIGDKNIKHTYINVDSLTGKGSVNIIIHEKMAKKLNHKDVLQKLQSIDPSSFTLLRFDAFQRGPPIGRPVEIILFSHNEKELTQAADALLKELKSMDGLLNIEDSREYSGPEYIIHPDKIAISRLGLNMDTIGQALRTVFQGSIISEVIEKGESFYIRVKYNQSGRSNINALKYVSVLAPGGHFIPINKVVKWQKKEKGPEIKKNYSFTPSITFFADVDLKKTTSLRANAQIKKKIDKLKYSSVAYKQGGEQESTKESLSSLKQAMLFVVFGIFAILLIMFNSFSIALLILSNVFLGFVGISWSFLLHAKPLSFFAMIGTVGLAGVVINSAIILVSFIEKLKKTSKEKNINKILAQATADRLRPIFITTLTTVLGLFPTAYGIGGHDTVLMPITLSITWGLITGTFLTLLWTPCGYAVIHDISTWLKTVRNKYLN